MQTVAADFRAHVVSFAQDVDLAKGAGAFKKAQGRTRRSGPRDWSRIAGFAAYGPLVSRSGRRSLGAFSPRRQIDRLARPETCGLLCGRYIVNGMLGRIRVRLILDAERF